MSFWICWTVMFIFIILFSPRRQFLSHVPNRRTRFTSICVKLANLAKQHSWKIADVLSRLHKIKLSYLSKTKPVLSHKQTVLVRKTTGLPPWAQFVLTSVHLKTSKAILLPIVLWEGYPKKSYSPVDEICFLISSLNMLLAKIYVFLLVPVLSSI